MRNYLRMWNYHFMQTGSVQQLNSINFYQLDANKFCCHLMGEVKLSLDRQYPLMANLITSSCRC